MKKLLLLTAFLISFSINAQERAATTTNLFSVSFLLPGVEYEAAVSPRSTVNLRLGTGFGYAGGMSRENEFGIYLNARGQYRHFYNFQRRLEKGKNISNNSGNYFGLHAALYNGKPIIGELESAADYSGLVGPVWGMQRVYNSGFKLNLFLGAGYGFNNMGNSGFSAIFGFSLGWAIFD